MAVANSKPNGTVQVPAELISKSSLNKTEVDITSFLSSLINVVVEIYSVSV